MRKRYWCQTCGEITPTDFLGLADVIVHTADDCVSTSIPLVEPLATPEPTTWGESGGDEAITLHDNSATPSLMVGDNGRNFVANYRDIYWMAEHGKGLVEGDVVQAINFLERSKT